MACMNIIYGFWEEFLDKFEESYFDKVQTLFNYFPLYTFIEEQVLVLHGGIKNFKLFLIKKINK